MANYSLIINSKFKPFSYAEMLAPVQAATQAHQELESAYSDLSTKANIWDKMAGETTDQKAHDIYQKYADDLKAQAEELAKNGLNPTSRQAMLNMKNRYTKEITPIETAFNKKQADIKAQQDIRLKDPSRRFNTYARDLTVSDYMDNPGLDVMGDNASGDLLYAQVAKQAANFKNQLQTPKGIKSLGLPFQYELQHVKGATPEEINDAIVNGVNAKTPIGRMLGQILDNAMEGSGVRNWSSMNGDYTNNRTYQELRTMAARGLWDALGSTDSKYLTDSYSMQLDLIRKKHAMEQPPPTEINAPLNPQHLINPEKVEEFNKSFDKYKGKKYFGFNANGMPYMTEAGKKALGHDSFKSANDYEKQVEKGVEIWARKQKQKTGKFPTREEKEAYKKQHMHDLMIHEANDPDFAKFMYDEINGGEVFYNAPKIVNGKPTITIKSGWGPNRLSNAINQALANHKEGGKDAWMSTEYDIPLSVSEGKKVFNTIKAYFPKSKDGDYTITPVQFDRNYKENNIPTYWKSQNNRKISIKDLDDSYHISHLRPSQFGTTAILESTKAGFSPVRIVIPKSANNYNLGTATANASKLTEASIIYNKGYKPQLDVNGNVVYDYNGMIKFTNTPLDVFDYAKLAKDMKNSNNTMYSSALSAFQVSRQEDSKNVWNPATGGPSYDYEYVDAGQ